MPELPEITVLAGIGNVYVQDPLFRARIHPLRKIDSLSEGEVEALWRAIRETLQESVDLGGSAWEMDLYGRKGRWDGSYFLVAYREGKPCPVCGTVRAPPPPVPRPAAATWHSTAPLPG